MGMPKFPQITENACLVIIILKLRMLAGGSTIEY